MENPTHPGEIVREECLMPPDLNVTEAAKVLGVTRQALNNLVNEKSAIIPEMAVRLEKAFGSAADMRLTLQMQYDLAQVRRHENEITVARYIFEEKSYQQRKTL